MKPTRILRTLLVFACLLVAVSLAVAQQVTILHVNDTHSHLDAFGPKDGNLDGTIGGIAKAATVIGMQRYADPQALFVHGGDMIHGDPFFNQYLGVPEFQMLQQLGINAMAVGNHEFQYTPLFLTAILQASEMHFPLVSANLDMSAYPPLTNWVTSTAIAEANGVKVGFFGITTPYDVIEQPAPITIDVEPQLYADAITAIAQLHSQGARVTVCLCHTGLEVSRRIAQYVPGLDVIVNAHDHVALEAPEMVGSTIIVSAGEYYHWVGRLQLNVSGSQVSLANYTLIPVDANIPVYKPLQDVVDYLKLGIVAKYGDIYHTQIAWATDTIPNAYDPSHPKRDTAMGDLVTDAYRAWTGTDIAMEASGFINEPLPVGPIVPADVFRSMSYAMPNITQSGIEMVPFRLVTFKLTGAELVKGLEIALTNADLAPQVSGIRFDMDSRQPPLSRVIVDSIHINGHKLDPTKLYSVTANEGFVMFLPKVGLNIQDVNILSASAYEAIRTLVTDRGVIDPASSGRVRDIGVIPGKN